jgi:hypothetical protein
MELPFASNRLAGLSQSELIERNRTISQGLASLARFFSSGNLRGRLFDEETIFRSSDATQSTARIAPVDAITHGWTATRDGRELKRWPPFRLELPYRQVLHGGSL